MKNHVKDLKHADLKHGSLHKVDSDALQKMPMARDSDDTACQCISFGY